MIVRTGAVIVFLFFYLVPFAQKVDLLQTYSSPTANTITVVKFMPGNKTIIAGDEKGHLLSWDRSTGSLTKITRIHNNKVNSLILDKTGQHCVTTSDDGEIMLLDLQTGENVEATYLDETPFYATFSADEKFLFIGTTKSVYKSPVSNLDTKTEVFNLESSDIKAVRIRDEELFVAYQGNIKIIDLAKPKNNIQIKKACPGNIESLDLAKDILACRCDNGSLLAWQKVKDSYKEVFSYSPEYKEDYSQILLSADGKYLLSGTAENNAGIWNREHVKKKTEMKGHAEPVTTFDFSKDHQYILTGSDDGTVKLWALKGVKIEVEKDIATTNIIQASTDQPKSAEVDIPTLENREVELQGAFEVSATTIDIFVWDNENVDGDSISLNINGRWVLTDYPVTKTRKKVTIELLEDNNNYLILYAGNLGKEPPNTAAISFWDNRKELILTLKSDLKKCGAVNLRVKK